jgi:uncharacterized membrane-anchored protein YitT (DUF2179 family)
MQRTSHNLVEDLFALIVGTLFVGFGLFLLNARGLLIGGTAGLALALTHLSHFSFGQIFFVINMPFYGLAILRKGWMFTLKTFVCVTCTSLWTDNLPNLLELHDVDPFLAAALGGSLVGTGMLILFRHGGSLGGIGVLAIYVQDRFGLSAGRLQMAFDVLIIGIGFFLVSLPILGLSIMGALVLNLVIALNYRPGRYQIT